MKAMQGTRFSSAISRRTFLQYVGAGSGAVLLAACAAPAPAGAPSGGDGQAVAGSTSISFWTPGGSDAFCEGFNTIGDEYEQLNPGIVVEDAQCYAGQESYNEILLANIASGTPPDSTILWTSPVAFAVRNALEPLDDFMSNSTYSQLENWPAGVIASCQYEGKVYGLPATASTFGIFYNAEMLATKGISTRPEDFPKSWDELRRLSAEFVQWNGDTLEQVGFVPWTDAVETTIWSAANGSQIYDAASAKFTIDAEQNVEMFEFLVDWLDEQYKGDWVALQASGNWGGYADSEGRPPLFQAGKTAALTQGFWFAGDMYAVEPSFTDWQVADMPVGPSGTTAVSGYWPNWLCIPKGSRNATAAFGFLDYISGKGVETWFNVLPDLPANKKVSTALVPANLVERRGQEFADATTAFFRKQMDISTPMWNSPVQDFANDQLLRASQRIMTKQATPTEALAEAQAACQAELEKVLRV